MPAPFPHQPIPLEALSEYDVREILLNGHEILEKPLTPAENFQRIVNQIDFSVADEDDESGNSISHVTSKSETFDSMSPNVWDNMRETLRMTMIEVNALADILAVIKEGKYLAINPVASDPPELNVSLYFSGKKRALAAAADILLKGSERLRRRHSELADARMKMSSTNPSATSSCSFHKALMHLRQEWRLKLHQNCILGDFSLRSIGSHFREPGNFEVRESDTFADHTLTESLSNADLVSGVEILFSQSMEALLNNSLDPALIMIHFHESGFNDGPKSLWDSVFGSRFNRCQKSTHSRKLTQRQRLFKAQRILASREILFQLAYEACGSKGYDNTLTHSIAFATQDEVIATLFPGVQISISMNTAPPSNEFDDNKKQMNIQQSSESCLLYHNCLGLQLHRMLASQHRSAWSNLASLPQPACGPVQVPLLNRAGGANALDTSRLAISTNEMSGTSGFSIAVAGIAGFATPAATAWSAAQFAGKNGQLNAVERIDYFGFQRLCPPSIGQDRLSLFTEWGTFQSGRSTHSAAGLRSNPFDDSVPGTAQVALMEHTLSSRGADDGAFKSVIGAHPSMFSRLIAMCRHYYLRHKVSLLLSEFALHSSVKMVVRWDAINSAFQTSARLCFYVANYDAYRSWLGLTVSSNGIIVFYADPPRTYRLGADLTRLRSILYTQSIHIQINFLDLLATKILGWTRLANNPFSGLADPDEVGDGPIVIKLFASPSAENVICIRASTCLGIRLFIAQKPNNRGVDSFVISDGQHFHHRDFKEVRLSAVHGKHVVSKIESIMTLLS